MTRRQKQETGGPTVIKMTMPNGKSSNITIYKTEDGFDLVFSRSTQGELLVKLPAFAAARLSAALGAKP